MPNFNISLYFSDEDLLVYLKDKKKYNKIAREAVTNAVRSDKKNP